MLLHVFPLLLGAVGVRVLHEREAPSSKPNKFIAGVPIVNSEARDGHLAIENWGKKEYLLVMRQNITDGEMLDMCTATKENCIDHASSSLPFVELNGLESDVEAVVLRMPGRVQFIEMNSYFKTSPHSDSNVENNNGLWGLERIGAEKRATTGKGVHVYEVSTGIRPSHVEFGGRAVTLLDATQGGKEVKVCGSDQLCGIDKYGLGTMCAGIAGGSSYGVAPASNIYGVQVLKENGLGWKQWILNAYDWINKNHIKPAVMSCSFWAPGTSALMKTSIDRLVQSGVTVVVSAGDEKKSAQHVTPANIASAITVGATEEGDKRVSFSNYGSLVDIWAPGSNTKSAWWDGDYSSKTISAGTRLACPHVAGAAALLLEADPTRTPENVLNTLLANAEVGKITNITADDTNKLLYVGAKAAGPTWVLGSENQTCTEVCDATGKSCLYSELDKIKEKEDMKRVAFYTKPAYRCDALIALPFAGAPMACTNPKCTALKACIWTPRTQPGCDVKPFDARFSRFCPCA